ncbi:hypothetical protein JL100_026875 [Skermanella mucosa]|uniref:hypothetical protein n=1 Tax=Skermanella mucosa TaxID=1789672 RepID=UPI00192C6CC8|nr:hypothetical protein [Skermanella mucosa]UEM20662.1 hypothetical protein JL100_026875 [Skermanella mucosa]
MKTIVRLIAITLSLSLALGGCVTTQGADGQAVSSNCEDPSLSGAERQLCLDNKSFNNTVLGGALAGGAIGGGAAALGCLAAKENPLTCALIGLTVGALIGAADGYATAKTQEASRQNVRAIDLVTADIRRDNEKLESMLRSSEAVSRENRTRLAQAEQQLRSGRITLKQAQAEKAKAESGKKQIEATLASMEDAKKAYERTQQQTGQSSPAFAREMQDMEKQIAQMRQQRDALNQAITTSRIG